MEEHELTQLKRNISYHCSIYQKDQYSDIRKLLKQNNFGRFHAYDKCDYEIIYISDEIYIIPNLTYELYCTTDQIPKIQEDSKIHILGISKFNNKGYIIFQFKDDIELYKTDRPIDISDIIQHMNKNYPYKTELPVFPSGSFHHILNSYHQHKYIDMLRYNDYIVDTFSTSFRITDQSINTRIPFQQFEVIADQIKQLWNSAETPIIDINTIVRPGFIKLFGLMLEAIGCTHKGNGLYLINTNNISPDISYNKNDYLIKTRFCLETVYKTSEFKKQFDIKYIIFRYTDHLSIEFVGDNSEFITVKLFINNKFKDCSVKQKDIADFTPVYINFNLGIGYLPFKTTIPKDYLEPYYSSGVIPGVNKQIWLKQLSKKHYKFQNGIVKKVTQIRQITTERQVCICPSQIVKEN